LIIFYEGVPGSGKTYDAIVKIIANLKKKRKVYTNIDGLDDPKCREMIKCLTGLDDFDIDVYLISLTREQTFNFWDHVEKGSLVVIDEMQKYFNSRDWQKEGNRLCADWCSTHRHEGFDAVFLSQRIEKVDTQIRTLTEWTYRYKKVNFLGKLISKSYVCFAYSGDETDHPLTKIVRQYNSKIFPCYKSYATQDVKELGIQTHANILKHPVFILIPVVIAITVFFIYKSVTGHGVVGNMTKSAIVATSKPNEMKGIINGVPADKQGLHIVYNNKQGQENVSMVKPAQPVRAAPVSHRKIVSSQVKRINNSNNGESYAIVNGKKIGYCEGQICEK
jgi:zona occludens toxin